MLATFVRGLMFPQNQWVRRVLETLAMSEWMVSANVVETAGKYTRAWHSTLIVENSFREARRVPHAMSGRSSILHSWHQIWTSPSLCESYGRTRLEHPEQCLPAAPVMTDSYFDVDLGSENSLPCEELDEIVETSAKFACLSAAETKNITIRACALKSFRGDFKA
eukprot:5608726-Amphidinium_carterae.1